MLFQAFPWEASLAWQSLPRSWFTINAASIFVLSGMRNAPEQGLCELKPFFFVHFLQ